MFKNLTPLVRQVIFVLALIFCCTQFIDPPLALLLGLVVAQTTGHPFINLNNKITNWLLKISVVGLGFGMNLTHALKTGKDEFVFIISSVALTLVVGWLLGKVLKVELTLSFLIASGTAICGGSAIAAISSILNVKEKQISAALGTIFILNAAALLLFPSLGLWLSLNQHQFGMWCALAIHDTSSVVGASAKFGKEALQIATTLKLERALWIIPLSLITLVISKGDSKKINIPYFIGLFIAVMCVSTYLPEFKEQYAMLVILAKKTLTLTIFFIGAGLSLEAIKSVGLRPLIQGVLLWLMVSAISLLLIMTT